MNTQQTQFKFNCCQLKSKRTVQSVLDKMECRLLDNMSLINLKYLENANKTSIVYISQKENGKSFEKCPNQ